jgi:aminopeptidase 2
MDDTMALSKAGLAKLSSALTMIDLWRGETEYLVWQCIGTSLSNLISNWWEHPRIVDKLNMFRRELFVPLIEKLGYEYSESESRDTSLLRTLAVEHASAARDEGVVEELKSRFKHYVETGDNSSIPADLQRVIFTTAVREGGRKEYEAIVKLHDNPATPTEKTAAIMAMGVSQDPELLQETLNFISRKARDQDVFYFFFAISNNFKGRRLLTKYFQDNYDILCKRFEGNYSFNRLVTYSSEYYTSEDDLKEIESFYKDKDTSKYNLALAQALDSIRSRTAYVARSTDDLWAWESLHRK